MRPIRDYMGDKRVAAALAAVAVLAVGYRVMQSRSVREAPTARSVGEHFPSPEPPEAASRHAFRAPSVSPGPPISGGREPAWNWDRNPFLSPSARRSEERSGGAGSGNGPEGEGEADASVPKLLGTVAVRGAGSAIFRSPPDGADRLVAVGGTIGDWTLTKVEPYRVILRRGKETRIVDLYRQ